MAEYDPGEDVANFYRQRRPDLFADQDSKTILGYVKQKDPQGFQAIYDSASANNYYKQNPMAAAVSQDNPIVKALMAPAKAMALPGEILQKGIESIPGYREENNPVSNLIIGLNKLKNMGPDAVEKMADETALHEGNTLKSNIYRGVALAVHAGNPPDLPSRPGDIAGGLLVGKALSAIPPEAGPALPDLTKMLSSEKGGSISLPPVEEPGLMDIKPIKTAAKAGFYTDPAVTGELAQRNGAAIKAAAKAEGDAAYAALDQLTSTDKAESTVVGNAKMKSALKPYMEKQDLLPEIFQNPKLRKLGVVVDQSTPAQEAPLASGHEGEIVGDTPAERVELIKALNKMARDNYSSNRFLSKVAHETSQAALEDLGNSYPEAKELTKNASDTWAKYTKRFESDAWQKFEEASPENAHKILTDTKTVQAIRNAGGQAVMEPLKQSIGYHLATDWANPDVDPIKSWESMFAEDHPRIRAIFGDEGAARLRDVAKQIATEKASFWKNVVKKMGMSVGAAAGAASPIPGGAAIGGGLGGSAIEGLSK